MNIGRRTRCAWFGIAIVGAAPMGIANAQDLGIKAPPQTAPIVFRNATVHSMAGPASMQTDVVIENGRISAVGEDLANPHNAVEIDAAGKHLYPGLIGPQSQTGLTEITTVRASRDYAEVGFEGFSPEAIPASAVNPDSTFIPVTRANGILTVGVFPSGGSVPGHVSVMRMDGWTWEEMTVKRDAGLVVNWPWVRPIRAPWMDTSEEDQLKEAQRGLERLARYFDQAKEYIAARTTDAGLPMDLRFEGMRSVLAAGDAGSTPLPLFIMAQDAEQITSAVQFCKVRSMRCVIVGGRDAVQCAEILKENNVMVICLGTFKFPRRDDSPYDEAFSLPARLEAAGIDWCLASGGDTAYERNLPYAAALAVAYGLSEEEAMKAITIDAARALGVASTLGSIEVGKSGTVLLTTASPLDMTCRIEAAFIDGRRIDLSNKQSALEQKYREKYRQKGEGQSR